MTKKELGLQNFIREQVLTELSNQSKKIFLNISEIDKRITEIEVKEKDIEKFKNELKNQMGCGASEDGHIYRLKYIITYKDSSNVINCLIYECQNCGLTYRKMDLSKKERKALKLFGYKF